MVTFHLLVTFGDVVVFFHCVNIFIQLAKSCCHCLGEKYFPAWECHRAMFPPFIPSVVLASCWREDAEVCCCPGLGCFHSCLSLCQGWARLVCAPGGRFMIRSRSTRAACTVATHQEALVVSRQWGNSSVHWEWKEMCLAPRLMEGSIVQPWPGSPLKTKTGGWTVGESSLIVVGYPDTEFFRRGRRPYSLSVWSLYLF